jgi:energy-coupling factor transporter ATP-binding protein EcfA2
MSAIIIKRPSLAKGKIVIINGPAGVGKTTLAKALSKYGRNSAVIEGDSIKRFIANRNDGEVRKGLGYLNGANVSSNYVKAGYDLMIFEYIFEEGTHIPKFLKYLTVDCPVYLFTLWADCTTVESREMMRENRERLGSRVSECWTAMKKNLPGLGLIISTENCRVNEIAPLIMDKIRNNEGRIEE